MYMTTIKMGNYAYFWLIHVYSVAGAIARVARTPQAPRPLKSTSTNSPKSQTDIIEKGLRANYIHLTFRTNIHHESRNLYLRTYLLNISCLYFS